MTCYVVDKRTTTPPSRLMYGHLKEPTLDTVHRSRLVRVVALSIFCNPTFECSAMVELLCVRQPISPTTHARKQHVRTASVSILAPSRLRHVAASSAATSKYPSHNLTAANNIHYLSLDPVNSRE